VDDEVDQIILGYPVPQIWGRNKGVEFEVLGGL